MLSHKFENPNYLQAHQRTPAEKEVQNFRLVCNLKAQTPPCNLTSLTIICTLATKFSLNFFCYKLYPHPVNTPRIILLTIPSYTVYYLSCALSY